MTSTSTTNYYAAGRDPALPPETVHIFLRPSIYLADRNTNEGHIDSTSGTLEQIAKHSNHISRNSLSFRNEIQEEMLSETGMRGGAGMHKCPFMKIAFANAVKADYEEPIPMDGEDERTTLFDHGWDGELVYTDIRTVTDSMINGGLVAGYIAP